MYISFNTLLNSIFFSTILIFIIYFILRSNKRIQIIGIHTIFLLCIVVLVRLFLPISFSFSKNFHMIKSSFFFIIFNKELFSFFDFGISLLHIFYFVWFSGSIFFLYKILYRYIRFKRYIETFCEVKEKYVLEGFKRAQQNYKKSIKIEKFKILWTEDYPTPFIIGLLHPYIVIPTIYLSKEEWYFIFQHELNHFYQYDLWVKWFIEWISILYWWNPFMYLLKRELIKIIEIRDDSNLVNKMSDAEQVHYMECLLKIMKYQHSRKSNKNKLILNFVDREVPVTKQRIQIVFNNTNKPNNKLIGLVVAIVYTLIMLSIMFVLEPYSILPEAEQAAVSLTSQDSYLIYNSKSDYDMYNNNKYAAEADNIHGFYSDNLTYHNVQKVQKEKKNESFCLLDIRKSGTLIRGIFCFIIGGLVSFLSIYFVKIKEDSEQNNQYFDDHTQ